ncbi:MAG: hypothetical protein ACOH2B_08110 [Burkholderiaceae bacterium]
MHLKTITIAALVAAAITQTGFGFTAGLQPAANASRGVTELSKKVASIGMGSTRTAVIGALGAPSNVIAPSKLKVNDIDRGSDIEYVLTWDNPGCSRIEVFFNARNQVTGTDAGQMCAYPMKPLANSYSCSKPSNAKYCH